MKFCVFQDQINQKKGQGCSYNFRANSVLLWVLVSMAFNVLENWKEKGGFGLMCTSLVLSPTVYKEKADVVIYKCR